MARERVRRTAREERRPREVWAGTLAGAVLILGHYAEDNLPAPATTAEGDRADLWTMAELKPVCQLVEFGREPRETYDEALLSILGRFQLSDASFGPVVRSIPDKSLFKAERDISLEPGDLCDPGPDRRRRVATMLARQLVGIGRPGLQNPFPALLRRLLEARGAGDVWMLGAEDHLAYEELRTIGPGIGAVYADERSSACAQATLQVLDPSARVERIAYLGDLPIDGAMNPLGSGTFGEDERYLDTVVAVPDVLPAVIGHWVEELNGSGEAGRAKYWEWAGELEDDYPGVTVDDSLTIAMAHELLPDEGGFAALLVGTSLLSGGMGLALRTSLVEENLVGAVAQFEVPNGTRRTTNYDLWILDTDRADDDPVYLMRLAGPSRQKSFPHLYDDPFDEALVAGELDRIVDALLHGRSVPYVGAPVDRGRILEHPSVSLRLVDYESSVDVGRSMREFGEPGNVGLRGLAEAYRVKDIEDSGSELAFLKAFEDYLAHIGL